MAALWVPVHRFVLLLFSDSLPFLPHPLLSSAFILTRLGRPPSPFCPACLDLHSSHYISSIKSFVKKCDSWHYNTHQFTHIPHNSPLLYLWNRGYCIIKWAWRGVCSWCQYHLFFQNNSTPGRIVHSTCATCHLHPNKYPETNWTQQWELKGKLRVCSSPHTCACVWSTRQSDFLIPFLLNFFFLLIHKLFIRQKAEDLSLT